MNRPTFDELAEKLAPRYVQRAQVNHDLWKREQDLAARERALIPEKGWEGKNDEQRRAHRETVLDADEALQAIRKQIADYRAQLAGLNGEIEGLEAERRAAEWTVRARLADVLAQTGVNRNGAERGEFEPAFEDAPLGAADQAAADQAAFLANTGQGAAIGSNIDSNYPPVDGEMPF